MPLCPECATEYPLDLDECPCSAAPVEMFRCARCGEMYEGSDACPACGLARMSLSCGVHAGEVAKGRCVLCGRAVCRSCERGAGRIHLCPEHAEAVVIGRWVQVYSNASEFEARLLRDNLLAEGIDAQIFSQKDNMLSVELGELSIVRLLVPTWEYEQAMAVIRDHMDDEGEVAFACPACGDAYEPGSGACAMCGALIGAGPPH